MKNIKWILLVLFIYSAIVFIPAGASAQTNEDSKLFWGDVKTGTYEPLHPNTLNWSGDVLDKGGFDLATLGITSNSEEADLVMNQYGAIGAASILKLNGEKLEDSTFRDQKNFMNSYTMAKGDMYLVRLSDGKYAKLRIDRLLPENGISYQQVAFSYVQERTAKTPPVVQHEQPTPVQPVNQPAAETGKMKTRSVIQLMVDQPTAIVQGKSVPLQVPPTIVEGTTLVPLRFVAEALGAEVEWDDAERKITLKQQGSVIELWIEKKTATVNGKVRGLEVAPTILTDTTIVPIRFISETFDQEVQYEPESKTIRITGQIAASAAPIKQAVSPGGQGFVVDMMGNWSLSHKGTFTGEQLSGSLSISQDGTYIIKLKNTGEFTGVWSIAKENEVEDYPEAIILKYAMDKSDWAVVQKKDGLIELQQRFASSNNALYNPQLTVWWLPQYEGTKLSNDPSAIEQFKIKDVDFSTFVDSYELWIEGGATNLYYKDTGNYATHEYQAGAAAGALTVHADGTYTMNTTETVSGTWRPSNINEVFGYEYSIILENGPDQIDWTLLVNANGKKMVSYASGTWADGSVMWLPYYIASPTAN
jgi:hypothetical protein